MGRRSAHTADELRELILDTSTDLIREGGLEALSAREVARRIGYSPGTLYNVFEDLDDLLLTVEGRLLDQLAAALDAVPRQGVQRDRIVEFARAYFRFTQMNPKLWNLLFEHRLPAGRDIPQWYQSKLDALLRRVEDALEPMMTATNRDDSHRAARVLWAGVHGITSLATADKLSIVTSEAAGPLVDDLVRTYLNGLALNKD